MIRHVVLNVSFEWNQNKRRDNYVLRTTQGRDWKAATRLLKQMSSLTTLHVKISCGRYLTGNRDCPSRRSVQGRSPENKVLAALIGVSARQSFIVEMAWPEEIRGDLPGAAFDVVLVDPYPNVPIVSGSL